MTIDAAARAAALTKTYRSGFTLGPLDLEIPTGYVVGLVGPNGAGKTTLIRLLLGLAHPTSGTVEVLGRGVSAGVGGLAGVGWWRISRRTPPIGESGASHARSPSPIPASIPGRSPTSAGGSGSRRTSA